MTFTITIKSGRKILMMMLGLTFSEALEAAAKIEPKMVMGAEYSVTIETETGA